MAAKIVPAPDYEDRVRTSFARQSAMATIGAELTLVTPGTVEIEMPIRRQAHPAAWLPACRHHFGGAGLRLRLCRLSR